MDQIIVGFDGSANITVADSTKVPTTTTVAGKALSSNVTLVKADVGLGSVDNTADAGKSVNYATSAGYATSAALSATATKLATARTINGVSFDGSANITLPRVPSTWSDGTQKTGTFLGASWTFDYSYRSTPGGAVDFRAKLVFGAAMSSGGQFSITSGFSSPSPDAPTNTGISTLAPVNVIAFNGSVFSPISGWVKPGMEIYINILDKATLTYFIAGVYTSV